MLTKKSAVEQAYEVSCAIDMIELGAGIQVLECELTLSRDRMLQLHCELDGVPPPKDTPPLSVDWYMTSRENNHASLFYSTYAFLKKEAGCSHLDALTKGYRLYLEHCKSTHAEAALNFTQAWALVRLFNADTLQVTQCCQCTGKFVAHKHASQANLVCGVCCPSPRELRQDPA
jgi:flagellar transcriptional activator FlhC